jgi:glycerophosphoryl diester phosphodiesterase
MTSIGRIYNILRCNICRHLFSTRSCLPAVFLVIIISAIASGCSTPSHVLSLDEIMARHKMGSDKSYTYRCTAGAHRGASLDHLENTLAALAAADQNDKYGFIEFDVQYSKDGEIVVFHDTRMLRLFGSLKTVGNTTLAELLEISGGEIAAYNDVIHILHKRLNIEIKSQGDDLEDQRLADEIIADARKRERADDILISSISGEVISYINENYNDIPTGQIFWLTSATYLPFDGLTQKLYEKIGETQADYLILHVANLHNIDDLIKLKPKDKTLVFWDFDDNIFILHKDFSDRLWGDSTIGTAFQSLRFRFASLF